MSEQEMPPWLKEHVMRLNQLQQNLQAILVQKQQLEIETVEIDKALEELKKMSENDTVYKAAGPVLIRTKRDDIIKELTDRKEFSNTRNMVLSKQEARIRENLKEAQSKLDEIIRGARGTGTGTQPRAE